MKIAAVVWRDACHELGETSLEDAADLITLREIGWLASETDETITLSLEEPDSGTVRNWLTIPKGSIVSMKTFPVGKFFKPS